jgi:hypothetical protein
MKMTNEERVLRAIDSNKARLTNADLSKLTGIQPHQQVFRLTQKLLKAKKIRGERRIGKEWHFFAR